MEEEEIEQKVDKKCQEIIAEGTEDMEITSTTEIRKTIKGIKNKKEGDKNNWKAEWIKKEETKWNRVSHLYSTEQKKRRKLKNNGWKQKKSKFTKEETKSKRNISSYIFSSMKSI